jgi:hypothetical protein
MTELLSGTVQVRVNGDGMPQAMRIGGAWHDIDEVVLTWRVETDWWREPVRRDYVRCLLKGDECLDVYRDIERDAWFLVRRYD